MKRSKIFLGVTTALLAITGIVAANAHRSQFKVLRYYYTQIVAGNAICNHQIFTSCFNNVTGPVCLAKSGNFAYGVYTQGSLVGSVPCRTPTKYFPN